MRIDLHRHPRIGAALLALCSLAGLVGLLVLEGFARLPAALLTAMPLVFGAVALRLQARSAPREVTPRSAA